ncbi:MAG: VOC family protein, partial [Pseudomonadota bacterium]
CEGSAPSLFEDSGALSKNEHQSVLRTPAIPVELAFLRLGDKHHDMVLVHNPNKTYRPRAAKPEDDREGPPSFHHFAFECDSREAWLEVLETAKRHDVPVVRGPVVHSPHDPRGDGSWGENESFYLLDPDGHRIEIFCDMARIATDGVYVNAAGERVEAARVAET